MSKTKVLNNGRLIVINFKDLDYRDFRDFVGSREELLDFPMVVSVTGQMFINTRSEECKRLTTTFETFMNFTIYELNKSRQYYQKKYPLIRNWYDWGSMSGTDEEKNEAYLMLMIQLEFDRRKVERRYKKTKK